MSICTPGPNCLPRKQTVGLLGPTICLEKNRQLGPVKLSKETLCLKGGKMRSLVIISLLLSFCKSDTRGAWDKEIDLRDHGFLLQLKYDEPLNPLKGGKVHLNLQNKHLRHHLGLRDLDID